MNQVFKNNIIPNIKKVYRHRQDSLLIISEIYSNY